MTTNKNIKRNKVLLAGATGYLGAYILDELLKKGYIVTIIVRNLSKIAEDIRENPQIKIIQADLTKENRIKNCCLDIDAVISTVGITKQKDKLSFMEVDYQANLNLLKEAEKNAVKKFIYISVLEGDKLKSLGLCKAKELFVDSLKKSELEYCIIRPNAFFSDIGAYYRMAKEGRVILFGNGKFKSNPIHGKDLAVECVNALDFEEKDINIGGAEIKTQTEIAELAFNVLHKKVKITYLPDWIRKVILTISKLFLPKQQFDAIEFFLTVMSMEMIAPKYGEHNLKEYFEELHNL